MERRKDEELGRGRTVNQMKRLKDEREEEADNETRAELGLATTPVASLR